MSQDGVTYYQPDFASTPYTDAIEFNYSSLTGAASYWRITSTPTGVLDPSSIVVPQSGVF